METITFTKKEYAELLTIKSKLDSILKAKKMTTYPKNNTFENAFGVFRDSFGGGDSLDYVNKLRKEWRK
ncbi:hypothetical protein COX24_03835 [bacterium (Candidatus Gribaldobacteria) CG23_combo_of_CG06-09_8_20_14_all_37_87_8]|uniref:Uncharacterized protein n=2 Tax=Candidatus Gribaldobacteria TaxID=2798536 RepID=A0A2G9ZFN6_9BACT|nr:MAG: hypothetical protein COX24_03835 [bacterium (Candidatus Gribaldobacteria) CG23_combo_of_CG06-09_8_20_14_all_37_87_8]PIR90414.1 MAG: hypothetical protein COU05_02100 [bacterium (Candidatus Gribaldobacteria) CG10_big_fil_rev_8_21_14_0_10_37_21]